MSYLDDLNTAQRDAVLITEGPLLVVAGAGAGKTRVLTYRILHLIAGSGVRPEQILALTFTNKAAHEMRDRVSVLLEEHGVSQETSYAAVPRFQLPVTSHQQPFLGTFHSLAVSILRAHGAKAGIPRSFTIFDRADSMRAIRQAMKDAGIDKEHGDPGKVLAVISRNKGDALSQGAYQESASSYRERVIADVWERYISILTRESALDFDDLLLRSLALLRAERDVLMYYEDRFRHVLIDEYQDTNRVQYELSRLLAARDRNICVVGDSDQSIYSWRGADLRNLLDFERDYPEARVVLLEENYRSTKTILAAANDVIKKNRVRKDKTLYTHNAKGERIAFSSLYDEQHEARFVAHEVSILIANGIAPEEIVLLYRTNFQSRALEESFLDKGIPYQVVGVRFFERKEIKDVLAYIRVVLGVRGRGSGERTGVDESAPSVSVNGTRWLCDTTLASSLARIVNVPPRRLGKATLLKLFAGRRVPVALERRAGEFEELLEMLASAAETLKPSETLRLIVEKTGIIEYLWDGTEEGAEREANIRELVTLALKYDEFAPLAGLERLVEDAALASDQDALEGAASAVRLMTVHAAKGLEFEHVFITGLEQGLFPHERGSDATDGEREEERRLFYVALTRAKKRVHLTSASVRTIFGSRQVTLPSEFLTDIRDELLEVVEPETTGYERVIHF